MPRPTILLVDDTKLFLALEKEHLKQSDVAILTAANGREALDVARARRPDLIYMDMNMPEMDGPSCCAALKADPALSSIPVIMVTTAGKEEDVARCRDAGCDGFLTKPIDRRRFLEEGRRLLPQIDRREKRVPCRTKVLFRVNGENLYGTCEDLSTRGIYIAYDGEVKEEEKVEVSFLVSGRSDDLVEAWGRVAWLNNGPSRRAQDLPQGFGVEFLAITEEALQRIRRFIGETRE